MILEIERTIPLVEVLDGILTAEQIDKIKETKVEFTYIVEALIDAGNEISGEPINTEELEMFIDVIDSHIANELTLGQAVKAMINTRQIEEKWFKEEFEAEAMAALRSWEEGQAAERDEEGTIDLTLTVRAD